MAGGCGMPRKKYKVVSLFSGAMGLDLGLDQTGRFDIIACVEKDHASCATIRENQRIGNLPNKLRVYELDIASLEPKTLLRDCNLLPGEVDLVVGGPPCQSFSTAGKRGTVQDPRGSLLWQFLNFVEVLRPKFFLMENVRGLLSAAVKHRPIASRPDKGGSPLSANEQPGSVVRLFAEDMKRRCRGEYHMDCFEVNAVNYGAPQLRERAIFIGNRFNMQVDFPEPTHGPPQVETDLFSKPLAPWATLGDCIGDVKDAGDVIMDFSPRKKRYLAKVPEGGNWRSLPTDIQKESMGKAWHAKGGRSGWWRRLSMDLPAPTLVTMPNHASTSLCHPREVRALSLREYARIQEFPDSWVFCGTPLEQYTQAGNAVPLRLGAVVGQVIAKGLDAARATKGRKLPKVLDAYRIVYVQSHVRTRQWFKGGETYVWKDGGGARNKGYKAPVTKRKEKRLTSAA
jgi:DNA (cytosine-5)-methyltransferase 1